MILPTFALGFSAAGLLARLVRSTMLDVLNEDYVRTAYAKGLPERHVVLAHALRNALIPVLTVIGISFAGLLGGAVVIETVFNIPGMGRLLVQSVARRDYPGRPGRGDDGRGDRSAGHAARRRAVRLRRSESALWR